MGNFPWVSFVILALLIVFGFFAIYTSKIRREEFKKTGKHPKGYYVKRGASLGVALGLFVGVALGNIAISIGVGLPIGVAIGTMWEQKYAHDLRPLTTIEEKLKKQTIRLLAGPMALGVLFYFIISSLR